MKKIYKRIIQITSVILGIIATNVLLIVSSYYISIIYNHCVDYRYTCDLFVVNSNDTLECYMQIRNSTANNYTNWCQETDRITLSECLDNNNINCYSRSSVDSSDECPPVTTCSDSYYGTYFILCSVGITFATFIDVIWLITMCIVIEEFIKCRP